MKINRLFTRNKADIRELMKQGKIPGVSIVVIDGEENVFIKSFGYADREKKIPVTSGTLFELASCSKAFTALGVLRLEQDGRVDIDEPVSAYLPWFYTTYWFRKTRAITLRHCLYHTSGIYWKSIADIPPGDRPDSLERTVRNIVGIRLRYPPGRRYSYATVNYDILGAVIETVSGMCFEDYMRQEVFEPLGLNHTRVGVEKGEHLMSAGYKAGLLWPSRFNSPPYRGNAPAGYIVSNAVDIARWMRHQLGLEDSPLAPLIRRTHEPDQSVPRNWVTGGYSGQGWQLDEDGRLGFKGVNPSFTCEIILSPQRKRAVAVLSNCSSNNTFILMRYIRLLLFDDQARGFYFLPGYLYSPFSYAALVLLIIFLAFPLGIIVINISGFLTGSLYLRHVRPETLERMIGAGLGISAFLLAAWRLPGLKWKYFWKTLLVWKPPVFSYALRLFLASVGIGYVAYVIFLLF